MDDVHTGQPALALAQKVIERVGNAGLPADLIPDEITSISLSTHVDAENALRTAVLEFADTVRRVERSIAAARRGDDVAEEFDVAPLGGVAEDEWRAYWPSPAPAVVAEEAPEAGEADEADAADEADEAADEADEADAAAEEDEEADKPKASSGGPKKRKGRR
jgi:XTP/dITP diphosphohydrolase